MDLETLKNTLLSIYFQLNILTTKYMTSFDSINHNSNLQLLNFDE